MVAAAKGRGQLNAGVNPLAVQAQGGDTLLQRREFRQAHPGAGQDPRRHSGLRQIHHPLGVFFNLLLLLAFGHQRLNLAGGFRHLVDGVHHRFVVLGDGQAVLRAGDIQISIETTAVEDRQRQSGGDAHLLRRMAEKIA